MRMGNNTGHQTNSIARINAIENQAENLSTLSIVHDINF